LVKGFKLSYYDVEACGLPIPAPLPTTADLVLGVDEHGLPYGLKLASVWRHIGIFGSTGSGKSTTASTLVRELSLSSVPVMVLDWAGEYAELLAKQSIDYEVLSYNLLPRVSLIHEQLGLELVLDTLKHSLSLSEHQVFALHVVLSLIDGVPIEAARRLLRLVDRVGIELSDAVERARKENSLAALTELVSTVWDAISVTDSIRGQSRAEVEIWAALLRRLSSIALSRYAKLFAIKGSEVSSVIEATKAHPYKPVVLDLSSIGNPRVKRIYTAFFLGNVFDYAVASRRLGVVVVVDEAHNVFEHAKSMLVHVLAEARKYELGLIVVSSNPGALGAEAIANINTLILHRLSSFVDGVHLLRHIHDRLASLDVGEAIVLAEGSEPIKITITSQ
jgi:DNA helicase HerA-like ATPase